MKLIEKTIKVRTFDGKTGKVINEKEITVQVPDPEFSVEKRLEKLEEKVANLEKITSGQPK